MRRKRQVSIVDEEKENENGVISHTNLQLTQNSSSATNNTALHHGPMYTIMSNVQLNETFHKKYNKEMQQLYSKMDHDAFMFTFIKMIKSAMEADENNDFANTTLLFCARFVGSYNGDETHPILVDICKWLLTTISNNPHIRFRLCQFVNMILNALGAEAALDDGICDNIMEYMLARLRDVSPSVRVQAILALQRLQVPDNPDDPVLRSYQFHLCSDPSPRVRQAVITSMGRNYSTIPYILDRLWDIDEKVRRHTYLHMSSYPVRSYKVSQRLMLMEQGLNDRSEMVRKVVVNIMLQQWIESYQKNLILLVSGLKLDSSESEIDRFRKITKLTLKEIFKRISKQELVSCIPFEEDGEFNRCVPHEKLTIEISLYWQCLAEYLQDESADELDLVVPELSAFCAYIERFCQSQKEDMDKFQQMEFQYILLALMEILYTFDLGDEMGRENLKKLLSTMLKSYYLEEKIIGVIVKCAENLIENQNVRLQYFVEIIQEISDLNTKHYDLVHDRNLINELMEKSSDAALNLKLSSLKVKILDLEEQEMNFVQKKDYVNAHKITEEKNVCSDEYSSLLRPLLEQHSSSESASLPFQQTKKITNETILKCLQVAFYMVVSENVLSLTPNVCKLYNDFICRHIASNQIIIRGWALKCGTAYSMLYESLAKDVFEELYSQFYKNHNIRIWKIAIGGMFELLDRYGMDHLVVQEQTNKSKKTGRQLYNTMEFLDVEEETGASVIGQGVDVVFMMSHFLDTCDDVCIISAIVNGFCRLILRGHIKSGEIIEKLLLRYFNPTTDDEINQILGVFLENLIQRKKQDILYPCLLPTVCTVLSAPYDSPLQEIKPEKIMRFVIDATRQEFCMSECNIHNKLAETFLQEMQSNVDNKDLCKLLAKELITLEINVESQSFKNDMKDATEKLIKCDFDPKTIKNLIDFKDVLDGKFNPTTQDINPQGSDEEKSDDENVTSTEKEKVNGAVKSIENYSSAVPVIIDTGSDTTQLPSPATEPKVISPSVSTPTTFGRENTVGQRYLRKSLNSSRNNSITESSDGPSRPAKIRIEARIDSDKKVSELKDQKTMGPKTSRLRRNLRRYVDTKHSDQAQVQNSGDEVAPVIDCTETSKKDTEITRKKVRSRVMQSPKYNDQKKQSKEKSSVDGKNSAKPVQEIVAVRRTRRNFAINKEKSPTSIAVPNESPEVAEELNNSEVVPESPTVNENQSITRLRRIGARRTSTLRHSYTSVNTSATINLRKASTNVTSGDGASSESHTSVNTPLRNGRKRVFHTSPKNSFSSDTSILSPLRKHSKVNKSDKSPRTGIIKSLQRTESESSVSSKSISNAVSPCSKNANSVRNKQLKTSNETHRMAAKKNYVELEVDSQPDDTAHATRSKKMSNKPAASSAIKRIKRQLPILAVDKGSNISTRDPARKERGKKVIMTRKRFSLESRLSSSLNTVHIGSTSTVPSLRSAASFTNSTVKIARMRIPSKIPVPSKREQIISSQISETMSFSSGTEESALSSLMPSTRRADSSQMKITNLKKNVIGRRPLRAPTSSSDDSSVKRISRRRQI